MRMTGFYEMRAARVPKAADYDRMGGGTCPAGPAALPAILVDLVGPSSPLAFYHYFYYLRAALPNMEASRRSGKIARRLRISAFQAISAERARCAESRRRRTQKGDFSRSPQGHSWSVSFLLLPRSFPRNTVDQMVRNDAFFFFFFFFFRSFFVPPQFRAQQQQEKCY